MWVCGWVGECGGRRSFTSSNHYLQTSPTDLRHFDPMLTALPPTITDLVSTDRALYLEGFDFVAINNFDYTEEEKNTPNEAPPDKDGDAPSNQVKAEVEVHSSEENGTTSTGD